MKRNIIPVALCAVVTGCTSMSNTQDSEYCKKLEPFTLKEYARTISNRQSEKLPVPKRMYSPKYPRSLLRVGVEGKATVRYDVLESGKISNIEIMSSSNKKFGSSFKKAVECWSFEPTDEKVTLQQTFQWKVIR